jgi:fructose-bisphosphate aldolase class I
VSGVILCDETLHQTFGDGTPFPEGLRVASIDAGIKVDAGTSPLALTEGELVTEGLDGLRARLSGYKARGATFAKWRAVLVPGVTTSRGIVANSHALARYAALCQEAELVPIVEPEVLMDGDHGIDGCAELTARTLNEVFAQLAAAGVDPAGIVLKPNMVVSGMGQPRNDAPEEVAKRTLSVLRMCVAEQVPGIAFLSGGQTNEAACNNLAAINRRAALEGGAPWRLTYSFGRALVSDALNTWRGREEKVAEAQAVLAANGERASRASLGWVPEVARSA